MRVFLGIGSNVEPRKENIDRTLKELATFCFIEKNLTDL